MKRPITIRPAELPDCAAIAHLQIDSYLSAYAGLLPQPYLDQFSYAEQEKEWRDLLNAHTPAGLLVAEDAQGTLWGYVLVQPRPSLDQRFDGEIAALHVQRAAQKQGVGRALVHAAAAWLQQRGCHSVFLVVLENNPARRFYELLGGQFLGEYSRFQIDDFEAIEVGYGWPDLQTLLHPSSSFA